MKIRVRSQAVLDLLKHLETEEELGEGHLQGLVVEAIEDASGRAAVALVSRSRRLARSERRELRGFHRRLGRRWREVLDLFDVTISYVADVGARFNRENREGAAQAQDFLFEALTRIHARSCATAKEISVLLRAGFPHGALARWRTLHELAVTAYALALGGPDVAEAYLLHETIDRAESARRYQEHADALGYQPLSPDAARSAEEAATSLLERFGRGFSRSWGWAAALFPDGDRPNFARLERLTGLAHMSPWYHHQSNAVHAGSGGTAMHVVEGGGDSPVLLAGPTNRGLADPAHGAIISLVQVTVTLLTEARGEEPDMESVIQMRTALLLSEATGEAALRAHDQLEARIAASSRPRRRLIRPNLFTRAGT